LLHFIFAFFTNKKAVVIELTDARVKQVKAAGAAFSLLNKRGRS
jgi:hypothetical protein